MQLNNEQKKAVIDSSRHIFLLAGAGSGKTRVIVERVKYLIEQGVNSKDILCITFTNKASLEMKERLSGLDIFVSTFHSYCYQLIKPKQSFEIFVNHDVFSEESLLAISNYKNGLMKGRKPISWQIYQNHLKMNQYLDFDDLMIEALMFVENHTFKYIFIDEFQDTNLLQFTLLDRMINKEVSVFAVGDPDQSIYAFRGARVELIDRFVEKYQAKLLKLEVNYRSNQAIVEAANNLIKHNINRFKKRLINDVRAVDSPLILIGQEIIMEKIIIRMIKQKKLFNTAILYRNHYYGARIKQILERNYLFTVSCMTFHEAKGLEFDCVMIIGCEILPYDKDHTYAGTEEERRLFFVALTRARHHLYLFSTKLNRFLLETKIEIQYF